MGGSNRKEGGEQEDKEVKRKAGHTGKKMNTEENSAKTEKTTAKRPGRPPMVHSTGNICPREAWPKFTVWELKKKINR